MNLDLDDETLLSAYLDGELGRDEARSVALALEADATLSGRLSAIAMASEAVAGLSRLSAPCGLASTVLARIAADEATSPRRRPLFWLATAASVAFAFGLAATSGLFSPTPRRPGLGDPGRPAGPTFTRADVDGPTGRAVLPPAASSEEIPAAADPLGPVPDPSEGDRRRLVDLLDRPGLRRVLVPVGALDAPIRDRVGDLLRDSARKSPGFVRVSVPRGVVIDPEFPDEAEVYAATMDGPEYSEFLGRLAGAFAEVVEDPGFDPVLGTQLADLGRVSAGTGHPAAGLVAPPSDPKLAAKQAPPAADVFEGGPAEAAPPEVSDLRGGPRRHRVTAEPAAHLRPTRQAPVLIWLTTAGELKAPN